MRHAKVLYLTIVRSSTRKISRFSLFCHSSLTLYFHSSPSWCFSLSSLKNNKFCYVHRTEDFVWNKARPSLKTIAALRKISLILVSSTFLAVYGYITRILILRDILNLFGSNIVCRIRQKLLDRTSLFVLWRY